MNSPGKVQMNSFSLYLKIREKEEIPIKMQMRDIQSSPIRAIGIETNLNRKEKSIKRVKKGHSNKRESNQRRKEKQCEPLLFLLSRSLELRFNYPIPWIKNIVSHYSYYYLIDFHTFIENTNSGTDTDWIDTDLLLLLITSLICYIRKYIHKLEL